MSLLFLAVLLETNLASDNPDSEMVGRKVCDHICPSFHLFKTINTQVSEGFCVILPTYRVASVDFHNHNRQTRQTRRTYGHVQVGGWWTLDAPLKTERDLAPGLESFSSRLTSKFLSCTNTLGAETMQILVEAEAPSSSCFARRVAVSSLY